MQASGGGGGGTEGDEGGAGGGEKGAGAEGSAASSTLLCRICECSIPIAEFQLHTDTCARTHNEKQRHGPAAVDPAAPEEKQESKKTAWFSLRHILRKTSATKQDDDAPAPLATSPLSIDDFQLLKPLSKGGFGSVYIARKKKTGDIFALKVMTKSDLDSKNMMQHVLVERDIMASMHNPFIVDLIYAFDSANYLYLVMEFMIGGDCGSLLKNVRMLDEEWARRYVAETALALEYIHSLGIIHRDLKPDNMLISGEGHIKLTDFGLSGIGEMKAKTLGGAPQQLLNPKLRKLTGTGGGALERWDRKQIVGTPDYLAPEVLVGAADQTGALDLWALGAIAFEFVAGIPPFLAPEVEQVFDNILDPEYAIPWPEDPLVMSADAKNFIHRLLGHNPAARLGSGGYAELKGHRWFSGITWETLHEESMDDIFIPQAQHSCDTVYFDQDALPKERPTFLSEGVAAPGPGPGPPPGCGAPGSDGAAAGGAGALMGERFTFRNAAALNERNRKTMRAHSEKLTSAQKQQQQEQQERQRAAAADAAAQALYEKAAPLLAAGSLPHDQIAKQLALDAAAFEQIRVRFERESHKVPATREEAKARLAALGAEELRKVVAALLDRVPGATSAFADVLCPFPSSQLVECERCSLRFLPADNPRNACIAHPGELDPSGSAFSCCGASIFDNQGCTVAQHAAKGSSSGAGAGATASATAGATAGATTAAGADAAAAAGGAGARDGCGSRGTDATATAAVTSAGAALRPTGSADAGGVPTCGAEASRWDALEGVGLVRPRPGAGRGSPTASPVAPRAAGEAPAAPPAAGGGVGAGTGTGTGAGAGPAAAPPLSVSLQTRGLQPAPAPGALAPLGGETQQLPAREKDQLELLRRTKLGKSPTPASLVELHAAGRAVGCGRPAPARRLNPLQLPLAVTRRTSVPSPPPLRMPPSPKLSQLGRPRLAPVPVRQP